jgi:hypothetical protein
MPNKIVIEKNFALRAQYFFFLARPPSPQAAQKKRHFLPETCEIFCFLANQRALFCTLQHFRPIRMDYFAMTSSPLKNGTKGPFFAKIALFSTKKRVLWPKIPHCVQKSG